MKHIRLFIAQTLRTSGWWGDGPLDGDGPADLLANSERLEPSRAASQVKKVLKSDDFSQRYGAMGVWDVVMSSPYPEWVKAFKALTNDVKSAADKGVPEDDEWYDEYENSAVYDYLAVYSKGKSSGKLDASKFTPKKGIANRWYVTRVNLGGGRDLIDLDVEVTDQYSGERKNISETVEPPCEGDASSELHGSKGDKQQSILITVPCDDWDSDSNDPEGYQIQVEVDSETGEFKEESLYNWEEM